MKSTRTASFGIVIALLFLGFLSCDKEKMEPVLSFAIEPGYLANDTILEIGDTVKVMLDITWNGKHKVNQVEMMVNDQLAGDYQIDMDAGQFSITIVKGLPETEVWDFKITDEGGNSNTISLTLTKDPNSVYSAIKYYDSIYLGAQSNINRPGFMSIINATYYNLDGAYQNSSVIDFLFYYSETDKGTVSSPGAEIGEDVFSGLQAPSQWQVRNTTLFQKVDITPEVFYMMFHDGFIIENFDETLADTKATDLTVGDVYVFQLQSGEKGIFYVISLIDSADGEVNIAIKVQE